MKRLGLGARARIIRADVGRALATLSAEGARFAVVFLDPPYDSLQGAGALEQLGEGGCLAPGAIVVAQHPTKLPPAPDRGVLAQWKSRRFGETTLTFFRARA